MRLTWKLTLSLAFCLVFFGTTVIYKTQLSTGEFATPAAVDSADVGLTSKLIVERCRAFRALLMFFVGNRGTSNGKSFEQMGLFDYIAFVQPQNPTSPIRWVERRLKNARLTFNDAQLSTLLLDLPLQTLETEFFFRSVKDQSKNNAVLFATQVSQGEFIIGLMPESLLTATLSDVTALSPMSWVSDGAKAMSLIETHAVRMAALEKEWHGKTFNKLVNVEGAESRVERLAVPGTNLTLTRVHPGAALASSPKSVVPDFVFLVGLTCLLALGSFLAIQKYLRDLEARVAVEPSNLPPIENSRQERLMWPLLQSLRPSILKAQGHLDLLQIENPGISQAAKIQTELADVQAVVQNYLRLFDLLPEAAQDIRLHELLADFFKKHGWLPTEQISTVPAILIDSHGLQRFLDELVSEYHVGPENFSLNFNGDGLVELKVHRLPTLRAEWIDGGRQFLRMLSGEWVWIAERGELRLSFQPTEARPLATAAAESPVTVTTTKNDAAQDVAKVSSKRFQFRVRKPRIQEVEL